ncbi:hypothetical protein C5689_07445 [Methylosinus sporium]|uniref:DUF2946 domain-containing protein n=1 Tax=Methylosinus sporium TaxID=428 RepID=A0A2U1SSH4_METSR|nr:hypothetical protein C5689_07445 [Methylosinus sporium]
MFGRSFVTRRISGSLALLLCVIILQSLPYLGASAFAEPTLSVASLCQSSEMGGGSPHDRHCRTLQCCALGCSAHSSAYLEAASSHILSYPHSMLSSSRRPGETRIRPRVTGLGFVARGPPAAL